MVATPCDLLFDAHSEGEPDARKLILDLLQRLLAEILGLHEFGFGLLDEFTDGGDVRVPETVVRPHGEFKLFHGFAQHVVDVFGAEDRLPGLFDLDLLVLTGEDHEVLAEHQGGVADGVLGIHGAVRPHLQREFLVVGAVAHASGLDPVIDTKMGL